MLPRHIPQINFKLSGFVYFEVVIKVIPISLQILDDKRDGSLNDVWWIERLFLMTLPFSDIIDSRIVCGMISIIVVLLYVVEMFLIISDLPSWTYFS